MKMRALPPLLGLLLLVGTSLGQEPATRPIQGRLEQVAGQPTLYIWGNATERGYAHGYLLARDILACIDADFAYYMETAGLSKRKYENILLRGPVASFRFGAAELAEMQGMLDGMAAALTPEEQVVPLLGRALTLADMKAMNTVGDWMALGCSTVALSGQLTENGYPSVVRNFDFPGMEALLQRQIVVVVRPSEPDRLGYVGVSHPGAVGILTGMNERGLFVSIHDVRIKPNFLDAARPNVPRLSALCRLLSRLEGKDDFLDRGQAQLKTWPTLYGNNFMVVARRAADEDAPFAGVFEYDKRKRMDDGVTLRAGTLTGSGMSPFLACTNHHRLRGLAADAKPRACRRYGSLTAFVNQSPAESKFNLERMIALVDQAALPSRGKQTDRGHGTLHQAIGETGPKRLHVRFGKVGFHIRDRAFRAVDVMAALSRAKSRATSTLPGGR